MATNARRGLRKSFLMTPDPYHVPGYGGFCPQFKYRIGQTFGRTTCRLLDSNDAASSGKLVLANINPAEETETKSRDEKLKLIQARTDSWGDQKLRAEMITGYTGFIPRSEHYFGKRYTENCISAISDFESKTKEARNSRMLPALHPPLRPIAKYAKPFLSKNALRPNVSPYYMTNDDQDKRFMSGYTGFVPRSRGLLGEGYPIITHEALNDFTDDVMSIARNDSQGNKEKRRTKTITKPIYPEDSGLVPHYTGHIPGEKFSYGRTFGHSTTNALVNIPMYSTA